MAQVSFNEIILKSPVILFTGAGASVPLGKPVMADFVSKLMKQVHGDNRQLLEILLKARKPDLEVVMEELETLSKLDYTRTSVFIPYPDQKPQPMSGQPGQLLEITTGLVGEVQSNIKHQIIREYRDIDENSVTECYGPIFDAIFESVSREKYCLPIFTTNYDSAIEVFCADKEDYALTDGFTGAGGFRRDHWSGNTFASFALKPKKRNIVLFKMHGSVDWMLETQSDRIGRSFPMYDALEEGRYKNVLIYPAMNKVATNDPYFTAYNYYARCADQAKLCLTIGYSFRDYDALSRLRGSMLLNNALKLALLSPDANKLLENLQLPQKQVEPLPFRFGEPKGSNDYLSAIRLTLSDQLSYDFPP